MRMYQDTRRLDFHALGREIKRKREAKGWTQEYLAQLVDRTPRSIMYFENRGQHPSLNTFYQIVTLLDIQRTEAGAAVAECEGLLSPKHDAGTATRHYRAFWQRRCRAAAAGAVLKPLGGNCAVLPLLYNLNVAVEQSKSEWL